MNVWRWLVVNVRRAMACYPFGRFANSVGGKLQDGMNVRPSRLLSVQDVWYVQDVFREVAIPARACAHVDDCRKTSCNVLHVLQTPCFAGPKKQDVWISRPRESCTSVVE